MLKYTVCSCWGHALNRIMKYLVSIIYFYKQNSQIHNNNNAHIAIVMLAGLCNKWPRASLASLVIYRAASDRGCYSITLMLNVISLPRCNGYQQEFIIKERSYYELLVPGSAGTSWEGKARPEWKSTIQGKINNTFTCQGITYLSRLVVKRPSCLFLFRVHFICMYKIVNYWSSNKDF